MYVYGVLWTAFDVDKKDEKRSHEVCKGVV